MKPEIKVMLPQAKEIKDCQQTTRSQGRGMEQTFPHSPEKKQAWRLFILRLPASNFQNPETICCLSHLFCGLCYDPSELIQGIWKGVEFNKRMQTSSYEMNKAWASNVMVIRTDNTFMV